MGQAGRRAKWLAGDVDLDLPVIVAALRCARLGVFAATPPVPATPAATTTAALNNSKRRDSESVPGKATPRACDRTPTPHTHTH